MNIIAWQREYPVPYADLRPWQRHIIVNGCGAANSAFRPPHATLFKYECGPHDYDYAIGGSWWDKIKADFRLRSRLKGRVKKTDINILRTCLFFDDQWFPDWAIKQIYHRWADLYCAGVLVGGVSSFRFDKKKMWPKI